MPPLRRNPHDQKARISDHCYKDLSEDFLFAFICVHLCLSMIIRTHAAVKTSRRYRTIREISGINWKAVTIYPM
jgi:hypothetical protein